MGYTFTIGNASPNFDKSCFPELYACWKVEGAESPDAPLFPNDEMTGQTSMRSPSYSVWDDFCRMTGIYSLFFDERGHLHAGHPGAIGLTAEFSAAVSTALCNWQAKATLPAGFEGYDYNGPPRYDPILARLIWLDFWVKWAISNCETPAIGNT